MICNKKAPVEGQGQNLEAKPHYGIILIVVCFIVNIRI